MELRKTLSKKSARLLTLLLTTLLIASASAVVYYSLTLTSTVTTAAPPVIFIAGTDSTEAGATGYGTDGTWVSLASLSAYPNATLTYDEAIKINNTDTGTHQFRLRHVTINNDTDTSNFHSIIFKLIAPNGTQYGGDFTYDNSDGNDLWDPPSDMSYMNILAAEEWAVKVLTKAASGASTGVTADITIYLDVQ